MDLYPHAAYCVTTMSGLAALSSRAPLNRVLRKKGLPLAWKRLESMKTDEAHSQGFVAVPEEKTKSPYTVSSEDFQWVERLLPPSIVPQPPEHNAYPTPSGWVAPSKTIPDEPYFVRRSRFHLLPVIECEKPRRSQRWLTCIRRIEGDIWALEKELTELVRPHVSYDPATRIHELTQTIWIKGLHKELIEQFLYDKGF